MFGPEAIVSPFRSTSACVKRRVKRISEPLTDRRVEEVEDLAARHTTI